MLVFPHTVITEPQARCRVAARTLVQGALDDVRRRGWRDRGAVPVRGRFVDEHPEYADLVAA